MDELIARARNGDATARGELLTLVRTRLRQWAEHALNARFAGRLDASDLTQITLMDVHQKLDQFVGNTEGEFDGWLRSTLQRNILDEVRRATAQKRSVEREQPMAHTDNGSNLSPQCDMAGNNSTPSVQVIRGEEADRLKTAVEQLPPDQRLVVQLVHLQGNSLALAAKQLNRTVAAVAKLLQRGMANLRKLLVDAESSQDSSGGVD